MWASLAIAWTAAIVLACATLVRSPELFTKGLGFGLGQFRTTLPLYPLAILAAGFIAELIPPDIAASWLGAEAGFKGILAASVVGGFIPGGPFISFPIALAFFKAGAGVPQAVALLTGWSVIAVHRVFVWEIPVTGVAFAVVRFTSSLILPPIAGVLAALIVALIGG